MNTIVFIGTNKSGSSREAIKAAEGMGYFTVVFTNNEKQIQQRQEYPEVHEMIYIDTTNLSEMRSEVVKLRTKGLIIKTIVSFIDSSVYNSSLLCDEFCHNPASSSAINLMEKKENTRIALLQQPYTPKFVIIKPGEQINVVKVEKTLNYPVVVKSSHSTGSKDVVFINEQKQLEKHVIRLKEKNAEDSIIIEEFIQGEQYLVEALVYKSEIMIAGVVKQEITLGKRFIITGYGVLANVPNHIRRGIEGVLRSVVEKLEVKNGALHLEIRHTKNGWKLIEINPRISGGAMNKMLYSAFGYNLVEETLKLYVGKKPNLTPKYQKYVFTKYLIVSEKGILEKVTGKGRARKSPGVLEVYVKPKKGTKLIPPLSMGHRYAYVIAAGESMEQAKVFAINAAKEIKFHLSKDAYEE